MHCVKMLSRLLWPKIFKRYWKILRMEPNNALPSSVKGCFFIGLGVGTGLAITAYVIKKISEQGRSHELVLALNQVTKEIKELRVSMVQHFERTASPFSNEQVLTSKRGYRRFENKSEVVQESEEALLFKDESSSDDDFFDLHDEDEQTINTESLQDRSILNVDELIKKCDELSEKDNVADYEREITILEELYSGNSSNVEVLWRCGRAYKAKADFFGKAQDFYARREAVFEGMKYTDKAIEVDVNHILANKWHAILLGIAAEVAPFNEKIPLAHKFREQLIKQIELNPQDATCYHLLGRWCFEVASLSWWQRQAATALIAEPPTSSMEEALSNFEQAEKIYPGDKSNLLYIGKCHQNLGDVEKAKESLRKALETPVKDYEDEKSQKEASAILKTL